MKKKIEIALLVLVLVLFISFVVGITSFLFGGPFIDAVLGSFIAFTGLLLVWAVMIVIIDKIVDLINKD